MHSGSSPQGNVNYMRVLHYLANGVKVWFVLVTRPYGKAVWPCTLEEVAIYRKLESEWKTQNLICHFFEIYIVYFHFLVFKLQEETSLVEIEVFFFVF